VARPLEEPGMRRLGHLRDLEWGEGPSPLSGLK